MKIEAVCSHCQTGFEVERGAYNRSQRRGLRVYCGRVCSGLGRRLGRSEEERKALKSEYDAMRRIVMRDEIKTQKAEHYRRTYDPVRAAEVRKARMPKHVEYCRRPAYRAKKADYDRQRRDRVNFGDFAEAAAVLRDLTAEVLTRQSRYEIGLTNGTINKAQNRRREYEALVSSRA